VKVQMRVRLRVKLALLLLAVAVLPLGLALLGIVVGGRGYQSGAVGASKQAVTEAQAASLEISLRKDIEKLSLALQEDPDVLSELWREWRELPLLERQALDEIWRTLTQDDFRMDAVLSNPVSARLRQFQNGDPRAMEMLVTDVHGQLIAATNPTEDYYQADETWWQEAYADGAGGIFISIGFDRSVHMWSVDLCIPVLEKGKVIGVIKAVMDMSEWFQGNSPIIGAADAEGFLIEADGRIVCPVPGGHEQVRYLPQWRADWASPAGWRECEGDIIRAHAPVVLPKEIGTLPVKSPQWVLVLQLPKAVALQEINRLTWWILITGLVAILIIFLAGLYVVDRSIATRIRSLETAASTVAGGDLSQRVDVRRWAKHLLGRDEVDDLAHEFNAMVDRVQESHDRLTEANELKANFIKVAGHELRTPISYILTLPKLMTGVEDVDKLRRGMATMESKARRLSDIIQSMFKLMPEQEYSEHIELREVDLHELLEDIYRDVLPFVEERRQRLIIEPTGPIPLIRADKDKLRDIIENLVGNAIKFTPDGKTIRIRTAKELGAEVAISVIDEGPGIPDDDLKNIFNPFFSTGDVMKHSSGAIGFQKRGMGLGLAVVKHFVEMHHGAVHVSTGPEGSTFTVILPIDPDDHLVEKP